MRSSNATSVTSLRRVLAVSFALAMALTIVRAALLVRTNDVVRQRTSSDLAVGRRDRASRSGSSSATASCRQASGCGMWARSVRVLCARSPRATALDVHHTPAAYGTQTVSLAAMGLNADPTWATTKMQNAADKLDSLDRDIFLRVPDGPTDQILLYTIVRQRSARSLACRRTP
jgi:hypothetical protein